MSITVRQIRSTALVVLSTTLGAAAIFTAPQSVATVDFFVKEVRVKVDAPLTDAQAIQLGNVDCTALRAGVVKGLTFGKARHEVDHAVGYASQQLGLSLSMPDGMFLVEAAEGELC